MAQNEKDHLANLLGQMADGQHHEEPSADGHEHADPQAQATPPPAAAKPPAARAASAAPTPQPGAFKPAAAAPKPPQRPAPVVVPRAAAPRPMATPQPAAPVARKAAAPPPPKLPDNTPAPSNESLPVTEEPVDEDDQVIVPAPPVEALAHTPGYRPRPAARPALNVEVKRTMIPVLLTIGVICIGVVILGMASSGESPFRVFRELWFAVPVVVIGLLFLVGAIFTMFQVRNELHRRAGLAAANPR